jgi:hypothetical protein
MKKEVQWQIKGYGEPPGSLVFSTDQLINYATHQQKAAK